MANEQTTTAKKWLKNSIPIVILHSIVYVKWTKVSMSRTIIFKKKNFWFASCFVLFRMKCFKSIGFGCGLVVKCAENFETSYHWENDDDYYHSNRMHLKYVNSVECLVVSNYPDYCYLMWFWWWCILWILNWLVPLMLIMNFIIIFYCGISFLGFIIKIIF